MSAMSDFEMEVPVACEQALLFGRAKQAVRGCPRSRVSSRLSLARVLFTISPKWRACSQATNCGQLLNSCSFYQEREVQRLLQS